MDSSIIFQGIKTIFIVIACVFLVGGIILLLRRYRSLRISEATSRSDRIQSAFRQESNGLQDRIDRLERRVRRLEIIMPSIPSAGRQQGPKNTFIQEVVHKDKVSSREDLMNDFVIQLETFVERYRKAKLSDGLMSARPEEDSIGQATMESIPGPRFRKRHKSLNDMNLIDWWNRKAHSQLLVCKDSLQEEFGELHLEVIEGEENEWNLIGVSRDGVSFFIVPRKGGWQDEVYQKWFTMEEGMVRPGEPIRTLRSPLPKAKRGQTSGWERLGVKGRVSIRKSHRDRQE